MSNAAPNKRMQWSAASGFRMHSSVPCAAPTDANRYAPLAVTISIPTPPRHYALATGIEKALVTIKILGNEAIADLGDCNERKVIANRGQPWRGKQMANNQGSSKLKRR